MLKPLHALDGCLEVALTASADIIVLDDDSTAYIISNMAEDDVTYLAVGEAPNIEVVRLTYVSPTFFSITRGADGTTPQAHLATTQVRYILAFDMVQEMLDAVSPPAFEVAGTLPIQVDDNGAGTFTVSILPTTLTSPDGTINVLGTYPDFEIDVERGAFGCCED